MLVRRERGNAIVIAINETYNVLIINGKKPKSPLNGFQLSEVNKVQRFFSCIIGIALNKRQNPMTSKRRSEKMAMPNIICRAVLSFTDLMNLINYSSFFSSVCILSFGKSMYPASCTNFWPSVSTHFINSARTLLFLGLPLHTK